MAVVAQWQSTALWMQMLRVRAPSAAHKSPPYYPNRVVGCEKNLGLDP